MTQESKNQAFIEPLFSSAFPRIFGKEESKEVTRSLVNAVLERIGMEPIAKIDEISSEHTATEGSVNCKMPRMDVRIVAAERVLDLEAQRYPEDVGNRSMFYAAQLISENTPAGATYKEIPQAIVITLLDTRPKFPETEEFVHTCRMHWELGRQFGEETRGTDRMLLVLVELGKVRERYNELTEEVLADDLLSWAYLLTKGYREPKEVERIMVEIPPIEHFAELYGLAVDDPKVKWAYEDAISAEREYQSRQDYFDRLEREAAEKGLEQGLEQGLKQGVERGIEQGVKRMVENLRAAGIDEAVIEAAAAKARTSIGE